MPLQRRVRGVQYESEPKGKDTKKGIATTMKKAEKSRLSLVGDEISLGESDDYVGDCQWIENIEHSKKLDREC